MKSLKRASTVLAMALTVSLLSDQVQPAVAQPYVPQETLVSQQSVVSANSWIAPRVENNVLIIGVTRIPLEHLGFAAGAIALLIATLSGLGGSSGNSFGPEKPPPPADEPDWLPERPLENRAVPKSGTEIATPGAVVHVSSGADQLKTVLMNPHIMQPPAVGGILVVNVTASTPIGVIGKVVALESLDNGLVSVTVESATLEEAYEEFSFDVEFGLADAIIYDAGEDAVDAPQPMARSAGAPASMKIDPQSASAWKCEGEVTSRIELGASLEVTGSAQLDIFDQYVKLELESAAELYISLLEALKSECEIKESALPRAWIPVAGPLGVEIGPEVLVAAEIAGGISYSTSTSATVGVVFDEDEAQPIFEREVERPEFNVKGHASVDAYVGLKAALKTEFGVAEASLFVNGGPGLLAEVESSLADEEVCFLLGVYGKVGAGLEAEVKWLLDWELELGATQTAQATIFDKCFGSDEENEEPGEPTRPQDPEGEFYTRPGELTNLTIYPQLATRIDSVEDGRSVYYGDYWAGTNIAVGGRSFGVASDWTGGGHGFEIVSGPTMTGTGTTRDPFVVRTTVSAGDSGLLIDQLDVFEDLSGRYQTTITVRNTSEISQNFVLYRGADCYLNRDDYGTGAVFSGGASCVAADGRRITLTDGSGNSRSAAGYYDSIWDAIVEGAEFGNEATPGFYDNGMGISWSRNIPAGGAMSFVSTFQLEEPTDR